MPSDSANSDHATTVASVFSRCVFQSGYPNVYFSQDNGLYTTLDGCYFELPVSSSGSAIGLTGSGVGARILGCELVSGTVSVGASQTSVVISNNIGSVTLDDQTTTSQRFGNSSWTNRFTMPDPLPQVRKLQQKLSGTTLADPVLSPVDNIRVVHLENYGPFYREHLFKKSASYGSSFEFLQALVPVDGSGNFWSGGGNASIKVRYLANTDKSRGHLHGEAVILLAGWTSTLNASVSSVNQFQLYAGGVAETLTVTLSASIDMSGSPRVVRISCQVVSSLGGASSPNVQYIRGVAVSLAGAYSDGQLASYGDVIIKSS
jgi:hypothetical protein